VAIASVNIKQCYDWIAHSIASLGAQQWGVLPAAITSLLSTMQSMVFFLILHMAIPQFHTLLPQIPLPEQHKWMAQWDTHINGAIKAMAADYLCFSAPVHHAMIICTKKSSHLFCGHIFSYSLQSTWSPVC
jgi:hypothetical protein